MPGVRKEVGSPNKACDAHDLALGGLLGPENALQTLTKRTKNAVGSGY